MNTTVTLRLRALIATVTIGALASGFAAVHAADNSTEKVSEIVKFGDLDASTPQGAAKLYRRISKAAQNVCGVHEIPGHDVYFRMSVRSCVQKAIADAVIKVGEPQLLTVYNSKNRQQPLPITVASAAQRH